VVHASAAPAPPFVKKLRRHVQDPVLAPATVLLLFAGQGVQLSEAPLPVANVFAAQAQAVAPAADVVPAGQAPQAVEFAAAAKVPGVQAVQTPPGAAEGA